VRSFRETHSPFVSLLPRHIEAEDGLDLIDEEGKFLFRTLPSAQEGPRTDVDVFLKQPASDDGEATSIHSWQASISLRDALIAAGFSADREADIGAWTEALHGHGGGSRAFIASSLPAVAAQSSDALMASDDVGAAHKRRAVDTGDAVPSVAAASDDEDDAGASGAGGDGGGATISSATVLQGARVQEASGSNSAAQGARIRRPSGKSRNRSRVRVREAAADGDDDGAGAGVDPLSTNPLAFGIDSSAPVQFPSGLIM
jgi:hypothetical protein